MAAPPPPAQNIVTQGNPYALVLKLALPTVFAMMSQSVVNEVDIVFFSQLPCPESSNAQAALLPSLIVLWAFGGSLSAVSVGTQALTARRFAEGQPESSGAVLLNSWVFSTVASILFTLLGFAVMPSLLSLLIKVPEVRAEAETYLFWRLLGITSMVVTFSFKSFFDGLGKTHVHMWSAIVMNIINVVLCYFLIFGHAGLPRLGMEGAGVAAAASTWVGLFILVFWATLRDYRLPYHPFALKKLDFSIIKRILNLSVPSAVATIAVMSGFALFAMIVSELDALQGGQMVSKDCPGSSGEAVNSAATTVIVGVLKLTFTACLAFGTSTATLVSQSLGEKDAEKAAHFGWVSVRLGLLIFGVVGFLEGIVFPEQILNLVTGSEAVRDAALGPLQMMGILTPMIAVGMILTQALFGAGNSVFVMVVELILHFTCLVPLAWILGITLEFGLMGIWSAAAVYIVLLTVIMVSKFAGSSWKKIQI
ncbi:MAG: MATE family efflux transporter [Polyangiaceae bacterium]|nr:MATE family efflux transporter [Polyangiaceae bacterium]